MGRTLSEFLTVMDKKLTPDDIPTISYPKGEKMDQDNVEFLFCTLLGAFMEDNMHPSTFRNRIHNVRGLFARMDYSGVVMIYNKFIEMRNSSRDMMKAIPWWISMLFNITDASQRFWSHLAREPLQTIIQFTNENRLTLTNRVYAHLREKKNNKKKLEWIADHRCAFCLRVSEKCAMVPILQWDGFTDKDGKYWTRRINHIVCSNHCFQKLKKGICHSCMCIGSYQSKRLTNYIVKLKVERGTQRRFCSKECQRVFHKGPSRPKNTPVNDAYEVD